jgi:hypothetical protein
MNMRYKSFTVIFFLIGLVIYLLTFRGYGEVISVNVGDANLESEKENLVQISSGRYFSFNTFRFDYANDCNAVTLSETSSIDSSRTLTNTIYFPIITKNHVFSTNIQNQKCRIYKVKEIIKYAEGTTPGNAQDILLYTLPAVEDESTSKQEFEPQDVLNASNDDLGTESFLFIADGKRGLRVLDNTDQEDPFLQTVLNIPDAKKLLVHSEKLYIAGGDGGVLMIDIQNPKFPKPAHRYPVEGYVWDVDSFTQSHTLTIEDALSGVVAQYAPVWNTRETIVINYILAAAEQGGMVIIDITNYGKYKNLHNDPEYLKFIKELEEKQNTYRYVEISDLAQNIFVDRSSRAFIGGENGLYIIDLFNMASLKVNEEYKSEKKVYDVVTHDDWAYLAMGSDGVFILDLRNKEKIELIDTITTTGFSHEVGIIENFLLVADGEAGLQIYDIRKPDSPHPVEDSFELQYAEVTMRRLFRNVTQFTKIDAIENTVRHIALDVFIFLVLLITVLLFMVGFVLPISNLGNLFSGNRQRLKICRNASGNQILSYICKIIQLFLIAFLSFIELIWERIGVVWLIFNYWFGKPIPYFFVTDGKITTKNGKFYPLGPGFTVSNRWSSSVFQKTDLLDRQRENFRERNSGVGFIERDEYLLGTANLKQMTFYLGPRSDEDPFTLRQEGETLRGYFERNTRCMETLERTRDEIDVSACICVNYMIDPNNRGVERAIIEQEKFIGFHQPDKPPAPRKIEYLRAEIAKLWKNYVKRFNCGELFQPYKGNQAITTLEWIEDLITQHLTQNAVDEINDEGERTNAKIDSKMFPVLEIYGLQVLEVKIEAVCSNNDELMNFIGDITAEHASNCLNKK